MRNVAAVFGPGYTGESKKRAVPIGHFEIEYAASLTLPALIAFFFLPRTGTAVPELL